MKRIIAFIFAIVFVVMMVPHNAIAASYDTVIFTSNAYYKNGLVNVDITISPNSKTASGVLKLKYNDKVLEYKKFAKTSVNLGLVATNPPDKPDTGILGEFRFSFANTDTIMQGGVIMTISFAHKKVFETVEFELTCLELLAADTTTSIPSLAYGCSFYYDEIVNPGSIVQLTTEAYYKNGLINVDIKISENSHAASGVLTLLFNDEVLNYSRHAQSSIALGLVSANPPSAPTGTPGVFRFGFANTEEIVQGGTIMTVCFSKIKDFDTVSFDLICEELIMLDTTTELKTKTYGCTFKSTDANSHIVKFLDFDGTLITKVIVEHGKDATPPENPQRVGYAFTGWNGDYKNVTEDRDITATYRVLGDIQGDGKVNTGDATAILRYLTGTGQLDPYALSAADFNGDGKVNTGDVTSILKFIVSG
ncbi:MAG: hypothetical protein GX802_06560 [Clostridiales bacterium]|nr:hypothetical protein [Clostridiales bacterium]